MARIRIVPPIVMGLALMLGACEQAGTETGEMEEAPADSIAAVDDEAALDELRTSYEDAWEAGDMNAVLGMMTSDYQEIGPEGTMDYDQLSAMLSDSANMPPAGATLSIETHTMEIAESGDIAYASGVSTVTAPGPDGQEMSESSQWVAGFEKEDGQWKIDRLAFAPATEPGTMEEPEGAADTTGTM
ncbi:MAG TPA: nuclear transport factor 2 family protein [Gemmatimonadota bacterium]|nr:nuclear transport factor 2 family protein [Gemmatimonadota bacterium]